jgi:hypothetical protein
MGGGEFLLAGTGCGGLTVPHVGVSFETRAQLPGGSVLAVKIKQRGKGKKYAGGSWEWKNVLVFGFGR